MTSSYLEEERAIMKRLSDNFAVGGVEIAWPNVDFDPSSGTPYIAPRTTRQTAFRTTIGTVETRHPGLLTVDIRTPLDEGYSPALSIADEIVAIFSNVTFDGITFRTPTADGGRPDPENEGWFRVQVDAPYFRNTYA